MSLTSLRLDTKSNRVQEIDGLRGIAVLAVLLWHFAGSMTDATAIQLATIWGRTGVDLFFVLSGFLIIGILVDEKQSPNVFVVFYWRRFLRIYPPYFALIAAYWVCFYAVGESPGFNTNTGALTQLLAQGTFTWNWLMAITDSAVARGFSVTWSVAIEEWFYLIAPWLIIWIPKRHIAALLITVGVASALGRAVAHLWFYDRYSLAPYVLTPLRLDGLCAGGLLALAMRSRRCGVILKKHAATPAWSALAFVVTLPIVIASLRWNLDANMNLWGHVYLSIGFSMVLLCVLQNVGQRGTALLRLPLLREAGRYSYTLYLFHPLFISLMFTIAGRTREVVNDWGSLATTIAALILSVAFSVLFYWGVERPALRLGKGTAYAAPKKIPLNTQLKEPSG